MQIEELESESLWSCYQHGYHCLVRSGLFFRQVLRPALSRTYFHRAIPLLLEYTRANHGRSELPPGFGDQMAACPLTLRDLMHLDYAISLGIAEVHGPGAGSEPVLDWPGPALSDGVFVEVDAVIPAGPDHLDDDDNMETLEDDDRDEDKPSYDM